MWFQSPLTKNGMNRGMTDAQTLSQSMDAPVGSIGRLLSAYNPGQFVLRGIRNLGRTRASEEIPQAIGDSSFVMAAHMATNSHWANPQDFGDFHSAASTSSIQHSLDPDGKLVPNFSCV